MGAALFSIHKLMHDIRAKSHGCRTDKQGVKIHGVLHKWSRC